MLHPARLVTFALCLVLGLVGRSVLGDSFEEEPPARSSSPQAVANQPVVEQLTLRWQQIPDVRDAHAGYVAQGKGGVLTGYAVCGSCRLDRLERRLVRDVWTSQLEGVTRFEIRVAHESTIADPIVSTWDPVEDAAELYERYGNGLVDPDGLAGS